MGGAVRFRGCNLYVHYVAHEVVDGPHHGRAVVVSSCQERGQIEKLQQI